MSDWTIPEMGVTFCRTLSGLLAENLDVLLISVSILSFETVMAALVECDGHNNRLASLLVVDVLSVKEHAKEVFLRLLPAQTDILCTHPMFGPER